MVRPGYKQTEVGVIPEDWEPCCIGDVASFVGGSQPPRSTFVFRPRQGYLRLIQIRDYKSDKDATYIPVDLAKKKCTKDDVMIGRYGPPIFQILRGIEGAYNVALIKAIPSGRILNDYLYYTLKGEILFALMESLSQRSSGQTGVELPSLKSYPLPLPPLPEQQAIAEALSDVDNLIAGQKKLIAKKQDIKTATVQQLLTGKTRLPGFGEGKGFKQTELGLIPEDWKLARLRSLLKAPPQYGINAPAVPFQSTLPAYIRITDISDDGYYSPNILVSVNHTSSSQYYLEEGDLVFARTGASVGRSYRYCVKDGRLVFAGFLIKIQPDQGLLLAGFLSQYIKTKTYWNWVQVMSMRSGQPGINGNEYGKLQIPVPNINEQQVIAALLSDMDKEINYLRTRLSKTKAIKQGMMQELLTGRTRLI